MLERPPIRTPEPVNSLEPQQVKLLTAIRNHVDAGKGYVLPIDGMGYLQEENDKVVAGHLSTLLSSGFIKEAPFYRGAFDITEKGRKYLLTTESNSNAPFKSSESDNQGWWDRFSGWFVLQFLARFYRE